MLFGPFEVLVAVHPDGHRIRILWEEAGRWEGGWGGGGRWAVAGGGRRSEAGGGTYEEKRGPDIRTDTVQRTGSDEDIWRIHEAVMKRFGCFHRSDRVSLMDRVEGW